MYISIVLLFTLSSASAINNKPFPKDFMFGVATAAYQIEGGWNADGKGENVCDHLLHEKPFLVVNNDSADIACDSYHKYKEDVALIKNLGVSHYRFSIAWSRILPNGMVNNINWAGINYYKNLIKELKDNKIEPMVTLHHFDLPQELEEIGGFLNEDITDWFADYARLCFETFGDSVKYWMTFNEPKQTCYLGYGVGYLPPARKGLGVGEYICTHNLLKAHAKAYHIYDKEFRPKQNGRVSIVVDTEYFEPATQNQEDKQAAETKLLFTLHEEPLELTFEGWLLTSNFNCLFAPSSNTIFTINQNEMVDLTLYSNADSPVYFIFSFVTTKYGWMYHPVVYGDYPEVMKTKIANRSKIQGFPRSRLPDFTTEEKAILKGTYDFVCINNYKSRLARSMPKPLMSIDWDADAEVLHYQNDSVKDAPWSMRKLVAWISKTYGNPDIIITENGSTDSDPLNDDQRISYHRNYLSNVRDAMEYDGVKVFGYTVWSALDNFEWLFGYSTKYGLHHVDFSSPNRTRTPKKSAAFYREVIKTRCLVEKCGS